MENPRFRQLSFGGDFLVPDQSPKEPTNEIQLCATPLLLSLAEHVGSLPVDTQAAQSYILKMIKGGNDVYSPPAIHSILTEFHVRRSIDSFFSNGDVSVSRINDLYENDNFILYPSKKGSMVADRKSGQGRFGVTDYDDLFIADGLIVDVETKVARDRTSTMKTSDLMSAKRVNERLAPLQSLFASDTFAEIVFLVSDLHDEESPEQRSFQERGGIVQVLRPSYHDFWDHAIQIYKSFKHLRKPPQ